MALPDLATLANIAEILGVLTIGGGVAYAVVEVRRDHRRRSEAAAFAILQAVQTGKTFHAGDRVSELPDGMAWEDFRELPPDMVQAISEIHIVGETLGFAVHRGLVPLADVDGLMGGNIRAAWRKLQPWAEHMREVQGSPNAFEWFQWLAERLEEHPQGWKRKGAYVAFRGWRP